MTNSDRDINFNLMIWNKKKLPYQPVLHYPTGLVGTAPPYKTSERNCLTTASYHGEAALFELALTNA